MADFNHPSSAETSNYYGYNFYPGTTAPRCGFDFSYSPTAIPSPSCATTGCLDNCNFHAINEGLFNNLCYQKASFPHTGQAPYSEPTATNQRIRGDTMTYSEIGEKEMTPQDRSELSSGRVWERLGTLVSASNSSTRQKNISPYSFSQRRPAKGIMTQLNSSMTSSCRETKLMTCVTSRHTEGSRTRRKYEQNGSSMGSTRQKLCSHEGWILFRMSFFN